MNKRPFAVCYGYRDELCIVETESAEDAVRIVEERLAGLGYSNEKVKEAAVFASGENGRELVRCDALGPVLPA